MPKSVFGPCRICRSEEHRTYNCTLSVINRKELLHKQRRCLKCFGKGHLDPRECWARNSRNPFPVPSSRPNTGTAVPWTYHFYATQGGSPSDEEGKYSIKATFIPGPGRKSLSALVLVFFLARVSGFPTEEVVKSNWGIVGSSMAMLFLIVSFGCLTHWAELEDVFG